MKKFTDGVQNSLSDFNGILNARGFPTAALTNPITAAQLNALFPKTQFSTGQLLNAATMNDAFTPPGLLAYFTTQTYGSTDANGNFAYGTYSDLFTFTSGSPKNVWNAQGQLITVPAGSPAFDYDPATGIALGQRIESAITNEFTYSEFPNGVSDAIAHGGNLSGAANIGPFPTGLAFGDNSTDTYAYKRPQVSANTACAISFFIVMDDGGAPVAASSSGDSGGDFVPVITNQALYTGVKIIPRGGALYKVIASATTPASISNYNSGVVKFSSNSSRTFKTSGWQIEQQGFVSSYIKTTSTALARADDNLLLGKTGYPPGYDRTRLMMFFDFTPEYDDSLTAGGIYLLNSQAGNTDYLRLVVDLTSTRKGQAVLQMRGPDAVYKSVLAGNDSVLPGQRTKLAFAFDESGAMLLAVNGSIFSGTYSQVPSLSAFNIFDHSLGSSIPNSTTIRTLLADTTRVYTELDLQEMTA